MWGRATGPPKPNLGPLLIQDFRRKAAIKMREASIDGSVTHGKSLDCAEGYTSVEPQHVMVQPKVLYNGTPLKPFRLKIHPRHTLVSIHAWETRPYLQALNFVHAKRM